MFRQILKNNNPFLCNFVRCIFLEFVIINGGSGLESDNLESVAGVEVVDHFVERDLEPVHSRLA